MSRAHTRRAFTLIELLVVIAIISLLLAIIIPSLGAARAMSRTTLCTSNMRQLCIGWNSYMTENFDTLPGGTNDFYNKQTRSTVHPGYPVNYGNWVSLDWLGTIGETGDQRRDVPSAGTIFKYVGEQTDAYKCPEDRIDAAENSNGQIRNDTLYSYTAAPMLTGAKGNSLKRTIWAENYPPQHLYTQWNLNTISSVPWLMVEEDEGVSLAFVTDSAWSNEDKITNRHRGSLGTIGYIDGHAGARKFQRELTAWRVYYELTDGRVVSGGPWTDTQNQRIKWGYLKGRFVNAVVYRP